MDKGEIVVPVLVIITVILGVVSAFIIVMPIGELPTTETNTVSQNDSYIIAKGEFDFIDVYTIDTGGGFYTIELQAHIIVSEIKYKIPRPSTDYPDRNYANPYNEVYRIALWICVDENITDYWFPMSSNILYEVTFRNIDFQIMIKT